MSLTPIAMPNDYRLVNGFRLTTESGVAISASDRTAQGTLYLTPHLGTQISLWDGMRVRLYESAQVSLALSSMTSGKNYDIFARWNSGALTLSRGSAWASDTTRANAVTLQNGLWCLDGSPTYRIVGTIRATGATTTEDSEAKRFVWNWDNAVARPVKKLETGTSNWTYGTSTWRSMNNSTANRVEVVCGRAGGLIEVESSVLAFSSTTTSYVGVGKDIASANSAQRVGRNDTGGRLIASKFREAVALGYHYYQALEYSTGSVTYYAYDAAGQYAGIMGNWAC